MNPKQIHKHVFNYVNKCKLKCISRPNYSNIWCSLYATEFKRGIKGKKSDSTVDCPGLLRKNPLVFSGLMFKSESKQ